MSARRVLISDPLSPAAVALLRETPGLEVHEVKGLSEDALASLVGDIDAWIVRSGTKVTRRLIEAAPKLRYVGRAGAGLDNVDVAAARERGIEVMNVPGGNSVAVAELVFGLLLSLLRRIPEADASLREGKWERSKFQGRELRGKTLGIVGTGKIGCAVAKRAQAFEMICLGHDPYVPASEIRALGIEPVELKPLLQRADVVSLHLPITAGTRGLVGPEQIGWMRKGALLVNAARGGLVDEDALLDAIDAGELAGAALDVFAAEPPTSERLRRHPKVVLTPHIGAATLEAQEAVGEEIVKILLQAMRKNGAIAD